LKENNVVDTGEENNEEVVKVNSVVEATDSIVLNEVSISIENGNVKLGDVYREIKDEKVTNITGFYDQSGDGYCVYVLTENKNVYVLGYYGNVGIGEKDFRKLNNINVDKLLLYDVEIYDPILDGITPERNRVYAVSGELEENIRLECINYMNE